MHDIHYIGPTDHSLSRYFSLSLSDIRPLHIAARRGLATVVQVLLSRGAAVMAVDEQGKEICVFSNSNQTFMTKKAENLAPAKH